jgi:8-oxo-dGTP pyrophosphatase MutT (NUDIX family)
MYPSQSKGVRATTIYDLVPLHFREWVTPRTYAMHARKYANAAATCDVVFAISEYTARDVVETLHVPRERIHVAYPAVKKAFRADGPAADLGEPYVLTVATLEPRKNLQTLVDAQRLLDGDLLLAVAGGEGWGDQPELAGPRVRKLGFVSDEELARLYRGAAVAVYPSRFEGFGIPVLEAMACGCPVVVSSHPSLDEASGDAAERGGARVGDPASACGSRPARLRRARARPPLQLARRRRHVPARLRGGARPVRTTEVMLVVYRTGPEFLVLLRTDAYWHLVAGGIEEGEQPDEAARRELEEETGLAEPEGFRPLPLELVYRLPDETSITVHTFAAGAPRGWEPVLNEEHVEYVWCSGEAAAELLAYPEPRDALLHVARELETGA